MEKILLIDKPSGITSHDVVDQIRRLFRNQRVGHAGTLDPMATGLLILLVGAATKKQAQFLNADKEYEAEITFGKETETYDAEGKTTSVASPEKLRDLTEERIKIALKSFIGKIEQTVPAYSAVKIGGQKLYELARHKKLDMPTLPSRTVEITKIILLSFQLYAPDHLPIINLIITCSKGTYIRSLASDLGKKLGCGAYLSALRRTRVGDFLLRDALRLEQIDNSDESG